MQQTPHLFVKGEVQVQWICQLDYLAIKLMTDEKLNSERLYQAILDLTQRVAKLEQSRAMPVTGALETKTIKRIRTTSHKLVKIYNDIPQILLEYAIKLSLTPESYRQKTEGAILLEEAARGNYWVVSTEEEEEQSYWLFPNGNITFDIFRVDSVKYLFRLEGEQLSRDSEFIVKQPAQLTLLPSGKQWELESLGVLYIGKNVSVSSSSPESASLLTEHNPTSQIPETLPIEELLDRLERTEELEDYVQYLERQLREFGRELEEMRIESSPSQSIVPGDIIPRDAREIEPLSSPLPDPYVPYRKRVMYAGFWQRFLAFLIDGIPLFVCFVIVLGLFYGFISNIYSGTEDEIAAFSFILTNLVMLMISWLYYSLMESGPLQATLGKIVMGIVVTDMRGNKISWKRATVRYFSKIISGAILAIGFIMVAFTPKKQALHDIISRCLVVKKRR